MPPSAALVWLLLVSGPLQFVLAAFHCPDNCPPNSAVDPSYSSKRSRGYRTNNICHCPGDQGEKSPCSWVGRGGAVYSFDYCIDAIPRTFHRETRNIYIRHLRSPTLLECSFPNLPLLQYLQIHTSNVSVIRPGAFRDLPSVSALLLDNNQISSLEPDTFVGLDSLAHLVLDNNTISAISQFAFRGLPKLATLNLTQNLLSSLPLEALLQPTTLSTANLRGNEITTIGSNVRRLKGNLTIGDNKLRCNDDLTWFICNLPQLRQISGRNTLKCASPDYLEGIFLHTLRNDDYKHNSSKWWSKLTRDGDVSKTSPYSKSLRNNRCESNTNSSKRGIEFARDGDVSKTSPYSKTVPTDNYTESPSTSDKPVSQPTTEMDFVILLGVGPNTNRGDKGIYTLAMTSAILAPLLLVLASAGVLFIYNRWGGEEPTDDDPESSKTDTTQPYPKPDTIQPYAVAYSTGQPGPAQNQAPEDGETIQPYAVAYDKDGGPEIKPYAVAYKEDIGQSDDVRIPLYAADTLPSAGGSTEARSTPLENGNNTDQQATVVKQPTGQSEAESTPPENNVDQQATVVKQPAGQSEAESTPPENNADQQATVVKQPAGQSEAESTPPENNADQQATVIKQPAGQSEADSTPAENDTDQQATAVKQPIGQSEAQSLPNDDEVEPENDDEEEENGNPSTRDGKGPYEIEEENEIPTASGIYGNGSQPSGSEDHSTSQVLYNPECQTSEPPALYEENPMDTGHSHPGLEITGVPMATDH
ncbi:hypothetical protein Bbelb_184710 [Branchiostoma belcheri]|nr:hypothetical protein Bbelb_184710 [Branchiostoma belcheri]